MTFKRFIRRMLDAAFGKYFRRTETLLTREFERTAVLAAQPRIAQLRDGPALTRIRDAEFRVFSQFGEDGILQYLIQRVPIEDESFIEFGVGDYTEANTRFLLINNNWRGLILDGSPLTHLRADPLFWRHDLTAVQAFITAENINSLLENAGFHGDVGLLSIDVDGNDYYWIWQAIKVASPRIVVCGYNSLFGARERVSVPYDPAFDYTAAHYSNLFYGASLPALCHLAQQKGYQFVGSNSNGHNVFFVRNDVADGLPCPTVEQDYVRSRFRTSYGKDGGLTFLAWNARIDLIADLAVVDVVTGQKRTVKELR